MFKKLLIFALFTCVASTIFAQSESHFGGKQSVGVSTSYAPTSQHILIGIAQQRRVWTAGFEYSHRLFSAKYIGMEYVANFSPFYHESDPALIGEEQTELYGPPTLIVLPPSRVTATASSPIGYSFPGSLPIYGLYGRTSQYAVALSPLGCRFRIMTHLRVQPTFAADAGIILSNRDLIVDGTSPVNFVISLGPGAEVFLPRKNSLRVEYVYRHVSNDNIGRFNPGMDQGVFRLTLSRYR